MSDTQYPKRTRPGDYEPPAETANEAPGSRQVEDPLAELARLIDEDPFADFNQRRREPYLTGNPATADDAAAGDAAAADTILAGATSDEVPVAAAPADGGLVTQYLQEATPQEPAPQDFAGEGAAPSADLPQQDYGQQEYGHEPTPAPFEAGPSAPSPGLPHEAPYEAPHAEPARYDDPVAAPFHLDPLAPETGYAGADQAGADMPAPAAQAPADQVPVEEAPFAAADPAAPIRRIEPDFDVAPAQAGQPDIVHPDTAYTETAHTDYADTGYTPPAADPEQRIEPALFEHEIHRAEPQVEPQIHDPLAGGAVGAEAPEGGAAAAPQSLEPDFDRDATERLYADLAAATQAAEPSFQTSALEQPLPDPITPDPVMPDLGATDPVLPDAGAPEPASVSPPYDPAADFEARLLEDLPVPADEVPAPALPQTDVPPVPAAPSVSVDPPAGASPHGFDPGDLSGLTGAATAQPPLGEPSLGGQAPQQSARGAPAVDLSGLEAELANTDFTQTDPVFDESGHVPPMESEDANAGTSRRRGLFILAGLIAVVVVGGAGAFFVNLFGGGEASGPAPVIRADKSPTKVQPQQSGEQPAQEQGKLVYDRVSGDGSDENTKLVPRQEEIADVGGKAVRVINPNAEETGLRGTSNGTGSALLDEDAPKRVRTVVVKPDGTIVGEIEPPIEPQTDQSPAPLTQGQTQGTGQEQSGQQAALQPAPLPGQDGSSLDSGASQATTPGLQGGQEGAASTDSAATAEGGVPLPRARPSDLPRSEAAPVQTQSSQGAASNFVPPSAPSANNARSNQPISLTPTGNQTQTQATQTATQTAAAQTQAAQQASAPQTTTFPAGSFVVQVAASRNEQDARSTAASISQRYSGQLSGYSPQVERADLGDRGIYYRVGVGPMNTQAAANSLCSNLKSAGLDCFVRRN